MKRIDLVVGSRYQAVTEMNDEGIVYLGTADSVGGPQGKALVRNARGREYYLAYASIHPPTDPPPGVLPPQRPHDVPTDVGCWRNHSGWAAPVWHDPHDPTPVHLYDLTHSRVPQAVRNRALLALHKLVDPNDEGWPE